MEDLCITELSNKKEKKKKNEQPLWTNLTYTPLSFSPTYSLVGQFSLQQPLSD